VAAVAALLLAGCASLPPDPLGPETVPSALAANARRLMRHFESPGQDPRPIILFAYSKGLPDTLDFVATCSAASGALLQARARVGAKGLRAAARPWSESSNAGGCDSVACHGPDLFDTASGRSRDAAVSRQLHTDARRLPVFTLAVLLAAGCAAPAVDPYTAQTVPALLTVPSAAGVRDLRARYREAVCRRLQGTGQDCADVLLTLAAEGGAVPASAAGDVAQRFRIVFVPGFLSECFEGFARPFADAERALRQRGFAVDYLRVAGRGTTADNARALAARFDALAGDPRPIIVFAYSKGVPDTLAFAAAFPRFAQRIAALVSVAGAVNGSPLADELAVPYRDWLASLPLPGCDRGSGDELHELRRDVRLAWWQQHGAAVTMPVFSLVAAPRPDRISPASMGTYRWLARIDPRNDGKLLWTDQVVPGGYLLGYANADHWAVAIPVAEELPALAALFEDRLPRAALVEAAIEVVAGALAGSVPPGGAAYGRPVVDTGRGERP
jgi:hypothetical protein